MEISDRCPACGKEVEVKVPDDTTLIYCPVCGARLKIEKLPTNNELEEFLDKYF